MTNITVRLEIIHTKIITRSPFRVRRICRVYTNLSRANYIVGDMIVYFSRIEQIYTIQNETGKLTHDKLRFRERADYLGHRRL